jgi:hypothetical protein
MMVLALLLTAASAQIDIYTGGSYRGRARDKIDCRGALTCTVDGGVAYFSADGGSSGSSLPTPPACNDGGSALGWDGGAFTCGAVSGLPTPPVCGSVGWDGGAFTCGTSEAWHTIGASGEPSYESSWANFGGAFGDAGFSLTGGRVYMRGMVKSGTSDGTCSTAFIFTLPTGFRPPSNANFIIAANGAAGVVGVLSDGRVCSQTGSAIWTSLDGINFSVSP